VLSTQSLISRDVSREGEVLRLVVKVIAAIPGAHRDAGDGAAGIPKVQQGDVHFTVEAVGREGEAGIHNGRVKTVLISTQHADRISQEEIRGHLIKKLISPLIGDVSDVEILVNPTGKFVIGGFASDTGLTGRKIMVDTYGGQFGHGGGAFSGKDPTKVDRSAAYMCRFVAKNLVANGLAKRSMVSVAYAIGRADPVMVHAEDENGNDLSGRVLSVFDFRPRAIIERLDLMRPIYFVTASYGHFGKAGLPWEEIIQF